MCSCGFRLVSFFIQMVIGNARRENRNEIERSFDFSINWKRYNLHNDVHSNSNKYPSNSLISLELCPRTIQQHMSDDDPCQIRMRSAYPISELIVSKWPDHSSIWMGFPRVKFNPFQSHSKFYRFSLNASDGDRGPMIICHCKIRAYRSHCYIYRLKNDQKKNHTNRQQWHSHSNFAKRKFSWSVCHGILCLFVFTALRTLAPTHTNNDRTVVEPVKHLQSNDAVVHRVHLYDVIHDRTAQINIPKEMASQTIIHLLSKLRILCSSLTRGACVYHAYVCNVPPLSSSQLNAISTGCFALSVSS